MTSHALDPPPPVTNCHTYSDPLPLERDVLYGRPLGNNSELLYFNDRKKNLYEPLGSTGEMEEAYKELGTKHPTSQERFHDLIFC